MIGERLKQVRKYHKLTQTAISEKFFITGATYCRYETDQIEPNLQFLKEFSVILGINLNWLITGEGEIFLSGESKQDDSMNETFQVLKAKISELEKENREIKDELLHLYREKVSNLGQK